jgi:hypothetical protein
VTFESRGPSLQRLKLSTTWPHTPSLLSREREIGSLVYRTSRGVVGSFMDRALHCSKLQLYAMLTGSRVVRTFPLSFVDLLGLAEANRFPADLQGLYLSAARDRFRALPSHHELRLPFRVRSSCAESLPSLAPVDAKDCSLHCQLRAMLATLLSWDFPGRGRRVLSINASLCVLSRSVPICSLRTLENAPTLNPTFALKLSKARETFRLRGFSPPGRFTPQCDLQVCCTLLSIMRFATILLAQALICSLTDRGPLAFNLELSRAPWST